MKDDGNKRETQMNQRRPSRNKGGKADKDRKWHIIYKIKQKTKPKITNRDDNVSFKRSPGRKKVTLQSNLTRNVWNVAPEIRFKTLSGSSALWKRLWFTDNMFLQDDSSREKYKKYIFTWQTTSCDILIYLLWNKPFTKMSNLSLRRQLVWQSVGFRAQTWWMNTTLQ